MKYFLTTLITTGLTVIAFICIKFYRNQNKTTQLQALEVVGLFITSLAAIYIGIQQNNINKMISVASLQATVDIETSYGLIYSIPQSSSTFNIKIKNTNIFEINDVEIRKSLMKLTKNQNIYTFEPYPSIINNDLVIKYKKIQSGKTQKFSIDLSNLSNWLSAINENPKNKNMPFLKLHIIFARKEDGKAFNLNKYFLITPSADLSGNNPALSLLDCEYSTNDLKNSNYLQTCQAFNSLFKFNH